MISRGSAALKSRSVRKMVVNLQQMSPGPKSRESRLDEKKYIEDTSSPTMFSTSRPPVIPLFTQSKCSIKVHNRLLHHGEPGIVQTLNTTAGRRLPERGRIPAR